MPNKNLVPEQKLEVLKEALIKAGLDFMITRHDSAVAHINVWIGPDDK